MSLRPEGLGRGGHIVFGADPVGICIRVGVSVGIRVAFFCEMSKIGFLCIMFLTS